jgi:hypothetical protein
MLNGMELIQFSDKDVRDAEFSRMRSGNCYPENQCTKFSGCEPTSLKDTQGRRVWKDVWYIAYPRGEKIYATEAQSTVS